MPITRAVRTLGQNVKSRRCESDQKDDDHFETLQRGSLTVRKMLKSCKIVGKLLVGNGDLHWDNPSGLKDYQESHIEMILKEKANLYRFLSSPCKGLLLFGPPGNGKTMIGKCIARQRNSSFLFISALSLTSHSLNQFIPHGVKMIRSLFAVATVQKPAVIFIDEIDLLLGQLKVNERDLARRHYLQMMFLFEMDSLATVNDENLLIIGATNKPWKLDKEARRRFVRKIYVKLPDAAARKQLLKVLLSKSKHSLSEEDFDTISKSTEGYACADITKLCKDAAMGPVRSKLKEKGIKYLETAVKDDLRHIQLSDFRLSLKWNKETIESNDFVAYETWNNEFGSVSSL